MSAGLGKLANSKSLRNKYAEDAKKYMLENLTWTVMQDKIQRIYNNI